MRIGSKAVIGCGLAISFARIDGFVPSVEKRLHNSRVFRAVNIEEDCGCGTVFAGKPSDFAQNSIDHRAVIGNLPIFQVDGTETSIDNIIGKASDDPQKEQIVQYNRIRQSRLLANGISLTVVSIGVPEKGAKLIEHLEVTDGEDWIFCDPENILYDALQLNSGVETTFFSIETPFAFKDRFFGSNGRKDGMKDLLDVLGKWTDAIFIPPKQEQAFQQGGAFVFKGAETPFAYYDAAVGTHLEVSKAIDEALNVANKQ